MQIDQLTLRNEGLRKNLEDTIQYFKENDKFDGEIKISVYDIKSKLAASVNGNKSGWAASIIKVPIMVEALRQLDLGLIPYDCKIRTNHKFILETYDALSKYRDGIYVGLPLLFYQMIVHSDNTATNMIADRIGINNINQTMQQLGMKKSMLGHLLCPGVPRYTSDFNTDGSNITCADDMALVFRHIYDPEFSSLTPRVRQLADVVLSNTSGGMLRGKYFSKSRIKSKIGSISDPTDGSDLHDVGIIDNHLIVSIMLNKVGQKKLREKAKRPLRFIRPLTKSQFIFDQVPSPRYMLEDVYPNTPILEEPSLLDSVYDYQSTSKVYEGLMKVVASYA